MSLSSMEKRCHRGFFFSPQAEVFPRAVFIPEGRLYVGNDTSEDEDFKIAAAENQRYTKHSKKNTKSEQTTSFLTKMKKLFRRK